MALIEIKVPDIGDFSDVPVIGVLVAVGDTVSEEQPLIEMESDKATMEVPSPKAGVVKELKIAVGDTVSEGTLIAMLEVDEARGDDAEPASKSARGAEQAGAGQEGDRAAATPAAEPAKKTDASSTSGATGAGSRTGEADSRAGRPHASPSVRAFARQLEIDLATIRGSGRKGRILRDDVIAALGRSRGSAGGGAAIPPVPAVDFSKFGEIETVEMTRIQKISGPALHRSWLNVPAVTHNEEADITELEPFRRELDAAAKESGYRVTLLSFLIKVASVALEKHWQVNASLHPDGDKLIRKHYVNIGFAADTPQGLVVPVIKDVKAKGIEAISRELGELSARARDAKLGPADIQGASFTISSLGGIGGTSFSPIVNAPEVAVLGVSRARIAPVWDEKTAQFVPRRMLPLSLSYDHRVIDGALAARFCVTLRTLLGDLRRLVL
jgi:pyruvate dehydrogenase E2 component (dihydrolipoamide acetyltransferase)